ILAAKLMLYVGLCVGIGGTFYAAWIAIEPQSLRTRTLTATTLACGFLAAVMSHRCARLAALRGERAASLDERPCNLIRPKRRSGCRSIDHRPRDAANKREIWTPVLIAGAARGRRGARCERSRQRRRAAVPD